MTSPRLRILVWVIVTMTLSLSAVSIVFHVLGSSVPLPVDAFGFRGAIITFVISFGGVGAIIASRRPHNPVGWVFIGGGLLSAMQDLGDSYGRYSLQLLERDSLIGELGLWLGYWVWLPIIGVTLATLGFLYPSGRVLSKRWKPFYLFALALTAIASTSLALDPRALESVGRPSPVGIPVDSGLLPVFDLLVASFLIGSLLSLVALAVRFRRSVGDERRQLLWLLTAVALSVLALSYYGIFNAVASSEQQSDFGSDPVSNAFELLIMFAFCAIPLSSGVAILRYRLYSIEVVVNRAVVYGALAFLITLFYGVVVIAPAVFIFGIGGSEFFLPLIATALIALAMQPLRQRLQHFANRVVYGRRATPYEAMADFSHRISDALSLEEVLPRMAEAAAGGIGAERARVRVFLPAGGELRSDWPAASDGTGFDQTISVEHQGELVGEIAVAKPPREPVTPSEEALLRDLAAQAGLALHNVRLTQELKSRLDQISEQAKDLRASRQRIVEAQDAERRRLERNIHDGAQQQLVAMSVKLRMVKQMMGSDAAKAKDLLDSLMTDTQETVETLRDLARGVFPPLLVERGVEQAISAHIGKLGLDAHMHIGEGFASTRFDPSVEAAIYFCCLEAMQNASKHAAGSEINVRLVASDGYIEFSVADQGPGFDPSGDGGGSGIQNMRDRVEALGGSLRISSKPGKGTTVSGRIPLA